jgi:biopolymer transport protein ExbD
LNFRKKDVAELELNLTPLIDVVFLLLIFFMVTTTFQKQSELQIKLPQASAKIEQTKTPLEVVINEEGNFFINNKEILFKDRITLMQTLARLTKGNTSQPLVLRADAKSPHQAVVTVMDVAGKIGLVKISIATTK